MCEKIILGPHGPQGMGSTVHQMKDNFVIINKQKTKNMESFQN